MQFVLKKSDLATLDPSEMQRRLLGQNEGPTFFSGSNSFSMQKTVDQGPHYFGMIDQNRLPKVIFIPVADSDYKKT